MQHDNVIVRLEGPLKPGDGVVFDAGKPEEKEEGGRVYEIKVGQASRRSAKNPGCNKHGKGTGGTPVLLCFGRGDVDFNRIHAGDKLWKTSDPELERRLRRSFAGDTLRFQRPISLELHGLAGKPLTVVARDESGHVVRVDSAMPLTRAETHPLTGERLREQLGRLGGTPFKLGELRNLLEGDVLLPISELNRLRREIVCELESLRAQPLKWTLQSGMRSAKCDIQSRVAVPTAFRLAAHTPHLIVLVRNLAQLETAVRCGVQTLYCEFEDPKKIPRRRRRFPELLIPYSAVRTFCGSTADIQNGRGMDVEAGALLRG